MPHWFMYRKKAGTQIEATLHDGTYLSVQADAEIRSEVERPDLIAEGYELISVVDLEIPPEVKKKVGGK